MLLKHPALTPNLKHQLAPLYVIIGQDFFLMNDAVHQIKQAYRKLAECDEKIMDIQKPADWALCFQEANSYSLFSSHVLLDVRYDKKSLDKAGKEAIQAYLEKINSDCLVLIQANQLPLKQLQWLSTHPATRVIQCLSLTSSALQRWITLELNQKKLNYDPKIVMLIYQYSQNNMLACAQVIEKLSLMYHASQLITVSMVMDQLSDQCDYSLYELSDACLTANSHKSIHLLRQANQNRTEPTLLLWLLTQEIRQLIQFIHLTNQSISTTAICKQLNIWSSKSQSYEAAIQRFSIPFLYQLLQHGHQLDIKLKSNQQHQIWQGLEKLALSLCLGLNASNGVNISTGKLF